MKELDTISTPPALQTAEFLWENAEKIELEKLEENLKVLDQFFIKEMVALRTETYPGRISGRQGRSYTVIIIDLNFEESEGKIHGEIKWENDTWSLIVDFFHKQGDHNIDYISIIHEGKTVRFVTPDKYIGKIRPNNILPTQIETTERLKKNLILF